MYHYYCRVRAWCFYWLSLFKKREFWQLVYDIRNLKLRYHCDGYDPTHSSPCLTAEFLFRDVSVAKLPTHSTVLETTKGPEGSNNLRSAKSAQAKYGSVDVNFCFHDLVRDFDSSLF